MPTIKIRIIIGVAVFLLIAVSISLAHIPQAREFILSLGE